MKKLLTFSLGVLAFAAQAQLPVSTTPENKNVVLEEYTGIYCQFCPDGHARAKALASNNPGDVVLVNVHAGVFADPQAGDPDFRTAFGTQLDAQADPTGYPAGSINRRVFPNFSMNPGKSAMSRGDWTSAANTVLGESSYVNVALEGDVDLATNTLTVDVEMYFTGSGAPAAVNLNVALLQNNIPGPQTGAATYNPSQILPDGQYNHEHMFRDFLTGQWGEVINTTSMGTLVTKTYTYNLPANINGVPLSVGDIEIAAFVAEGQEDIVTGANGPINYIAPAGSVIADLEAASNGSGAASLCDPNYTPEISVTNNSTDAASNFEVSYTLNGGTPFTQTVSASLAGGASTNVTFSPVTLQGGLNTISYEVSTDNNANLFDLSSSNNIAGSGAIYILRNTNTFGTGLAENFESYQLGEAENINNALTINPEDWRVFVVDNGISGAVTWPIGAFEHSEKCFRWQFANIPAGEIIDLTFEKVDLSNATGNNLTFNYAYSQRVPTSADELEVAVSEDCGASWTVVWTKSGADLATNAAPVSNANFYPRGNEWTAVYLDMSAYDGASELMVRFRGSSDAGNNAYIDNILINNSTFVGLEESRIVTEQQLYPNPANNQLTSEFNLASDQAVTMVIKDLSGKPVLELFNGELEQGIQKLNFDISSLPAGAYFLSTETAKESYQQKLIVQ